MEQLIRTIMDNPLVSTLIGTVIVFTIAFLGYQAAKYRYREKTASQDVQRERDDKALALREKDLELQRIQLDLRLQTERAENERAIREAMTLSMRRVATLEEEQDRTKEQLRVMGSQYTEAKEMIDDLHAQLIQRDRQSEQRTQEIDTLKTELATLKARVAKDETERDRLLKVIADKDSEIEKRDARINELTRELREVREELEQVKTQIKAMEQPKPEPPPDIQPPAADEPKQDIA